MNRLACMLPLLLLVGCPDAPPPPVASPAPSAAQPEEETPPAADAAADAAQADSPAPDVVAALPELRYYAFDG